MAIGTFNNRSNLTLKCVVFKHSSLLTILCLLLFGLKFQTLYYSNVIYSFVCDCILNLEFSSVIVLLVLMSGDVAENPGPCENPTGIQNCLSIAHLNIRSIRTKLDYIKDFFLDFDILCFTETHLTNDITTESLLLDGFSDPFRLDKTAFSSGLLTYVSNKLVCKRLEHLHNPNIDAIWNEIMYKGTTFILCNVYRPPNSNVTFWDNLNISIEMALDYNKNLVIVGDLNDDLLNPNCHHLKNCMLLNNLRNVINEPTRITNTTATLIDPIIISDSIKSLNEGTINVPLEISDHKSTFIFFPFTVVLTTAVKRKI